ncbi:MAG: hypothetical protein NYU40_04425 [Aigarchaeota archaeon]|jgi:hypothetical protein|nr:hypothetical protein [Candidatus Caldarchaeales archaeon]
MKQRSQHLYPVPVRVEDLASLVRLASSRWDYIPHLIAFRHGQQNIIAYLQTMPMGKVNIPMLFHTTAPEPVKKYVVYTALEKEETRLSDQPETGRYISYPIIHADPPPHILEKAITGKHVRKIRGIEKIKVKALDSIMRLVSAMTDESFSPPVWCYRSRNGYNLAVLYPVYEYYDSIALPFLYYVEVEEKPPAPFIAYSPTLGRESIRYTNSVSDTRYSYGRLIFLEKFIV